MKVFDAAVIGGGPAGSFCALLLASEGYNVCLFEKKAFPRETLCGEFLSYEVSNHLKDAGIFEKFLGLNPNKITSFSLFTTEGNSIRADLKFTAFGLKRSTLDEFLLTEAAYKGVRIFQPCQINSVNTENDRYIVSADSSDEMKISAGIVIGAYGKKNLPDKSIKAKTSEKTSPYNGVKMHIDLNALREFPKNEIHIYTGENIYCGLNAVNEGKVNICFLEKRVEGDPPVKERLLDLFYRNKFLNKLFTDETEKKILSAKIYGTGGIYFGKKNVYDNGMFLVGDAAGIIAPLAGDGLGIALESARVLVDTITDSGNALIFEKGSVYKKKWEKKFRRRINAAGIIQNIVFSKHLLNPGVKLLSLFPRAINTLIDYTRK